MTDLPLLGEIARLPQLVGPLSVEFLASGPASHFHLLGEVREALQVIVGPCAPGTDGRTKAHTRER